MRLIVNPHKVDIIKDELVNEREIDISKCTFEFAEEITQEYVKEAYFTYNGETYKQIINNNECAFPSEVLKQKGMVEIGVVAYLVENDEEIKRYNPSPAYFNTLQGSLRSAQNSEPITPSEMEQFEQQLQNGLNSIDDKLDEVDTKMETVDTKIDEIDTAIEETNNLDLDVNKQNNKTTVTLTKKNGSTKSVDVLDGTDGQDGTSLEFMWQGTSLGIKTDDMQDYVFVDLQGVQGQTGPQGEPFTIKKTYSSVAEMNVDFDNMELGDYVMIASSVEIEDNAKLYTRGEQEWIFITDFSGATGIRGETGLTPNIQIGTVTSGTTPSVTRTGTNENPILNFVLEKGEKGNTGSTGPQGETGNGIVSVIKTSTSGLTDTYTITYTNGNTSTFNITNGEDGEVTQEQLDKVIKDLEYWKKTNNALPKVEGEGTDITLNDTADSPLTLGFKTSESTQNSTTGKNKLNINNNLMSSHNGLSYTANTDGSFKVSGTATGTWSYVTNVINDEIEVGTYTFSISQALTHNIYLALTYEDSTTENQIITAGNTSVTFTTTKKILSYRVLLSLLTSGTAYNETIYAQLESGSSATPFEKFTENQPTPNPDYPQEIHVIKGDNEIVIENKNFFYGTIELGGININTGLDDSATDRVRVKEYIPIKANTEYTISGVSATRFALFYDKNKNYLGYILVTTRTTFGTFTSLNNSKYIRWYIIQTNTNINEQLELGNQATTYIEHKEQKYPLSLGVENLFDKDNANILNAYFTHTTTTITSSANDKIIYIPCNSNETYTIQKVISNVFAIGYANELPNVGVQLYGIQNDNSKKSLTLTTGENSKYIVVRYWKNTDTLTEQEILDSIQIEEGPTAHSYSPYGQTPIEMCNINNNADEFFKNVPECEYYDNTLEEGKWYKYGRIGKVVLDGSENWNTKNKCFTTTINDIKPTPAYADRNQILIMSNYFQAGLSNYRDSITNLSIAKAIDANIPREIAIKWLNFTYDVSEFKEWLSTHNLTSYYVLENPTKTLLSDTLQEQLDNISYAMAYQDQTNVSQVNEDRPFIISASTIKDMKTLEDRITALEQSISL